MASASKSNLIAAAVCATIATALAFAPDSVRDAVRGTVRDAAMPAERVVAKWADRAAPLAAHGRERLIAFVAPLSTAESRSSNDLVESIVTAGSQRRIRALEAEVARLREELDRRRGDEAGAFPARPGEPLVVPDLLAATVLGEESAALWRAGKLLDRGSAAGVSESSLVLESDAPLVDQGQDSGLEAGQPVFAGRTVLGRIARVGKYTSTLQLVTDPQFRGLARVVRKSDRGVAFGPRGILEGDGGGACRLKFVEATAAIAVGDAVYTDDLEGLLPAPAYYGRVVEAELAEGAAHWTIRVEPAVPQRAPREVHVLRRVANPARFAVARDAR